MVPELLSVMVKVFCHLDIFSLLPSNDPKNGDIILHMCTIMKIIRYMVSEIWRVTENFLSFWTIFCPFIPLKTQKIKILNKLKKTCGDIIILH